MHIKHITKQFAIFALALFACQSIFATAKYKAIPLNYLSNEKTRPGAISFNYRIFDRADCQKFLGRDMILDKGIQPVQISFTNNSDQSFAFSLSNFSFPCVSYHDVAAQVQFDTAKRVLAWGIPGLFLWPLLIPAIIEVIESPKANRKLLADYSQKTLNNQVINPHSSLNGLIFVAKEHFDPIFSITLIDQLSQKPTILSTSYQLQK